MAYTYDDFLSAANAAGMLDKFSQQDLDTARKSPEFGLSILGLKQDYMNATTEEQRLLANEAANQLRRSYGNYTAGANGLGYDALPTTQQSVEEKLTNYPSFQFSNEDAYQKLLSEVANQGSFTYDPNTDPAVQSFQKMYAREGQRASADALAQAAAMSGGQVSSFAQTAAQQAGNYYAGQMADRMPTLEQAAYDRFLSEQNAKYAQLQAMQEARDSDMEAWLQGYNMLQNSYGSIYGDALDEIAGGSGSGGSGGSGGTGNGGGKEPVVEESAAKDEHEQKTPSYNRQDMLDDVAYAFSIYPSGDISDYTFWAELVSLYGEDLLKERGLRYNPNPPKAPEGVEQVRADF